MHCSWMVGLIFRQHSLFLTELKANNTLRHSDLLLNTHDFIITYYIHDLSSNDRLQPTHLQHPEDKYGELIVDRVK